MKKREPLQMDDYGVEDCDEKPDDASVDDVLLEVTTTWSNDVTKKSD